MKTITIIVVVVVIIILILIFSIALKKCMVCLFVIVIFKSNTNKYITETEVI